MTLPLVQRLSHLLMRAEESNALRTIDFSGNFGIYFILKDLFVYSCVCARAHVSVCGPHARRNLERTEEDFDSLEMESQVAGSHHVGTETQTLVLCKSSNRSYRYISPAPKRPDFK